MHSAVYPLLTVSNIDFFSVSKGIVSFERENRDLSDAVLVKETLDLVAACDRVLSKPGTSF